MERMSAVRWMRWAAAALLVTLAACGGGGDSSGGAAVVPARAGAADIGPAGGSVSAVFEGGASVTLTVPAGALTATTAFRIDPVAAPGDAVTAMSMFPAGLVFSKPATLSITLPAGSDVSGQVATFDIQGTRVPIGGFDTATRTMTVDLRYLGIGATEPAAAATQLGANRERALSTLARPLASGAANQTIQVLIQKGDLLGMLFAWHQLVVTLSHDGSRDNTVNVEVGFEGLLGLGINTAGPATFAIFPKDQVIADAVTWGNVVCGQLTFAVSTINTAANSQLIQPYEQAVKDVIVWGGLMQEFNNLVGQLNLPVSVPCPALQPKIDAPIRSTFATFLGTTSLALDKLKPPGDFDQLLTARVPELLSLDANLRLVGTMDDLAAQVEALIVTLFERLRQGAYDDCRANQRQVLQRDLLARIVSDRSFDALRPYGETDLFSDIEFCGMAIGWELQDTQGTVLQSGTVGGGATAGTVTPNATLDMTGADKLVIKGPLSALMCPGSVPGANPTVSPHSNNEQLGFDAGPLGGALSSVGVLTPANDSRYLEVSNRDLPVAQLKSLSQPTGSGNGELSIQRQRDTCFGEFPNFSQHHRLAKLELDFDVLKITTASLPNATVNVSYSATLVASGGKAPLTWAAAGLPAGLTLDPGTGAVSGVTSATGTSSVRVTVTGADGLSGTRTLNLAVTSVQLRISTTTVSLPLGAVKTSYSATLQATGGTAPLVWSATGLGLGLSLDSQTGVISGVPSAIGTLTMQVTVTGADGATDTRLLSLTIFESLANVEGDYSGLGETIERGGAIIVVTVPPPVVITQSGSHLLIFLNFLKVGSETIGNGYVADIVDAAGNLAFLGGFSKSCSGCPIELLGTDPNSVLSGSIHVGGFTRALHIERLELAVGGDRVVDDWQHQ